MLIIGYGNPLRTDDAIGQRMAQIMAQRIDDDRLRMITAYQLTPELMEPISQARFVVFIDARVGSIPGEVLWENVEPETGGGAFTHHVSPGTLLGAAQDLYGAAPTGILISIVGADFEYGSELSAAFNKMLPDLAERVESIIKTKISVLNEESGHYA
jgi:hydrogenase maturation protease